MPVDPTKDPLHDAALMEACSLRVTQDKIDRAKRGEFDGIPSNWKINYSAQREPVFEPNIANPREAFENRNDFIQKAIDTCQKLSPAKDISEKTFSEAMADMGALIDMNLAVISERRLAGWHSRDFSCLGRLAKQTMLLYWLGVSMAATILLRKVGIVRGEVEIKGHRAIF